LVLLGLGYFLCAKLRNGTLLLYINRRFIWLTFLAALALITLSGSIVWTKPRQGECTSHRHGTSWATLLIMILPVALGTLVPPVPLGADALTNRTAAMTNLSVAETLTTTRLVSAPPERDLLDWLQAFSSDTDPNTFVGQEVTLVGFVHQDERLNGDYFLLSRFVIVCCVADAIPVGMIVHWPDAAALDADKWVEVHGTFEVGEFDGQTTPFLVAERVTPTEMPYQPYLYP
jgi:uncharacterized repeat protein (TIGR03943 family)